MDLEALGAWGEFLGGIAGVIAAVGVMGSLIFVGIQLRQQNVEARRAATHGVSKEFRNISELIIADPSLVAVFLEVLRNGFDELDETSGMRAQLLFQSLMRFYEDAFVSHEAGRLDGALLRSLERALKGTIASIGFRQYWESRSIWYTDSFIAYIENLMGETGWTSVREEVISASRGG
jgi:hypothetical protein